VRTEGKSGEDIDQWTTLIYDALPEIDSGSRKGMRGKTHEQEIIKRNVCSGNAYERSVVGSGKAGLGYGRQGIDREGHCRQAVKPLRRMLKSRHTTQQYYILRKREAGRDCARVGRAKNHFSHLL